MSLPSPDHEAEKARGQGRLTDERPREPGPLLTACVTLPQRDCLRYRWQEGRLWVCGLAPSHPELPADLAVCWPEEGLQLRLLLLLPQSAPPETWLRVRLVAALQMVPAREPSDWLWLGCLADGEGEAREEPSPLRRLAEPAWRRQVEDFFVRERSTSAASSSAGAPALRWLTAEEAAQALRSLRAAVRQARRARQAARPSGTLQAQARSDQEAPLTWRTAASLAELQRTLRAGGLLLRADASLPFAEPARLLRFVAPRFQPVLRHLLDEDEQVLAFVERPRLRLRLGQGLLRRQERYLPEGLLLVSDRQVLWLQAYFAQGSSFSEGGYVARTLPVERLRACLVEREGPAPDGRRAVREEPPALLRAVLQVAATGGQERLGFEFPAWPEAEEALQGLSALVRAFLPLPPEEREREGRLRVWPTLTPWEPGPGQREELADLGGQLPQALRRRFETALMEWLAAQGLDDKEVLLSLGLPALDGYGSPPRWLALTRSGLLVLEAPEGRAVPGRAPGPVLVRCLAPWSLSSLELRYSLLGSGLTLFEPRTPEGLIRYDLPFAGPALALVLPLFVRLRTLLRLAPGMRARLKGGGLTEEEGGVR